MLIEILENVKMLAIMALGRAHTILYNMVVEETFCGRTDGCTVGRTFCPL